MATEKFVKDLVISFLTLSPKRMNPTEIDVLERTYFVAFKPYTNKQISEAAELWMKEAEYYPPKPRDIIFKIQDSDRIKNDEFLVKRYTCSMCHQKVSAMLTEGICLDCAGIPDVSYEHVKPLQEGEKVNYKMEGRIKCQKCGAIGMCIKEPADTGTWECRKCYTRMTPMEIVNAWKTLGKIMEKTNG